MFSVIEDKKDLWIIYECCPGKNLNESLFEVKGEFFKGERIYMVHHSDLYHNLRLSNLLLRELIEKISEALLFFARIGIVHADLKPDNILIDVDMESMTINSLKIIDFGSAFVLNQDGNNLKDQREFAMSTPEYLPPEI